MKNAAQCAKRFATLYGKLPAAEPHEFPEQDEPVAVLVQSFLLMDATVEKAQSAYKRIRASVVDFNDLRVTMPHELVQVIGSRYPRALERCQRMRDALRAVYLREHEVTLDPLRTAGKREVKKYLESLEGMVPYTSARVMVLAFDTHAIPVDDHLVARLRAESVVDEDASTADVAAWLARQVKASDGAVAHYALQAWSELPMPKPASRSRKKTTSKAKTSKKTTTKKKTTTRKKKTAKT